MKINQQVFNLANDVLNFPFDECSEHDFLDKQEDHVRSYVQVVNRFVNSAKRLQSESFLCDVSKVNTNVRHMWQAKELRTQVLTLIDHLNELAGNPDSGFYRSEEPTFEQYFESQKDKLLETINSSRFSIWVAVAWFTDKDLADALINKVQQGLSVRVVMNKDDINNNIGHYLDGKVELITADPLKKLMHHKFCVFDFKVVAHGSFNWTNKAANINNETLTVSYSTKLAEEFSQEFVRLVHQCKFE
ncbi:phospholipase D-like domain-containing protein [Photobacterium sanguinicancri]|uniref:phospholipase D n=1 Tax=Photobacterium sanguinicancri TaxID=875932 RepID=A0ABX4G7Q7_9GAMM|nr:phospholipase D-like domain-containing protein [Photobacterium sanguinicancri]OZS45625.1 hypothetical protein ASV53_02215 [Photobacterium sanguinicancri]